MTRKDYVKFAALFAGEVALSKQDGIVAEGTIKSIIYSTADIFAQDNPRFDRQKFYAASGL